MRTLAGAADAAPAAARSRRDGATLVARGAAARPREAGRAALHRQGHRRLAAQARPRHRPSTSPGYDRRVDDRAVVERQLGRPPRAFRRVAVRCPFGRPAVTEQAPYDDRRRAVPDDVLPDVPAPRRRDRAARGGRRRRALERGCRRGPGARERASRGRRPSSARCARLAPRADRRDGGASLALGIGGASRPGSLKCLHAHAAFALARPGYELGERILAEVEPLWPRGGCCTSVCISRMSPRSSSRASSGRRATAASSSARDDRGAVRGGCSARSRRVHRRAAAPGRPDVHARRARRLLRAAPSAGRATRRRRARRRRLAARPRDRRRRRVPPLRARRARLRPVTEPRPDARRGRTAPQTAPPSRGRPLAARLLVLAVVFGAGVALGEALHDNPQPGGTQTLVRTLQPAAARSGAGGRSP